MKKAVLFLLVVLVNLTTWANGNPSKAAVAQGIVVDASSGDPITGARVILQATGEVVYTDEHGRFALAYAPAQPAEIIVEFVSFQTTQLTIADQGQMLQIQLEELR